MKYFRNKIGIKFNETSLVMEQNNYATKIVNVYIVYDLDNWPKNLLRNFNIEKLFDSTNIVKDIANLQKYSKNININIFAKI